MSAPIAAKGSNCRSLHRRSFGSVASAGLKAHTKYYVAMQFDRPPKPSPGPKPGDLSYRVYFLNGGRNIVSSHEFFAASDDEAIKVAEAWR